MNNILKRTLGLILCLSILCGIFPFGVFASNDYGNVRVIVENNTFTEPYDGKEPAWTGTLLDTTVALEASSDMISCVVKALNSIGATEEGSESNYFTSVNSLNAFDAGSQSGWMLTLNDWFMDEGGQAFSVASGKLSDKDEIRLSYSLNYGVDLGYDWSGTDKRLKDVVFSEGTLEGFFTPDSHEYTLTVPYSTSSIKIIPTALNKNFQVKTEADSKIYKRGEEIPVNDGTVIKIRCGDKTELANYESTTAQLYTFTVKKQKAPETIKISFFVQKDGAFISNNETLLVYDGLAEEYGYTMPKNDHTGKAIESATVFDALVAAHKLKYNELFTPETAKNYLDKASSGFISKAFGEDASATGFFVNGVSPDDGISVNGYRTSYPSDAARIYGNDTIEYFFYQDSEFYSDFYTYFSTKELTVPEDATFEVTLNGFMALSGMGLTPIPAPINGEDGYITVNTVNEDGSISSPLTDKEGNEITFDGDGRAYLSFDKAGRYVLTASGFEGDYDSPIISPRCVITVKEAQKNAPYFDKLEFMTSGLSNWEKDKTFSAHILSYDLNIRTYSTSQLALMSTTAFDVDKYTASASYKDINGETVTVEVLSGKMTYFRNLPFGKSVITITLSDKENPDNATEYSFRLNRPYDTTALIKSVVINPVGRSLYPTKYLSAAEGSWFKTDENGDILTSSISDKHFNYTAYLFGADNGFSLQLNAKTQYVHMRASFDGENWTEISDKESTPVYSFENGRTTVYIQCVSDSDYIANAFNDLSLIKEYTFTVDSAKASCTDALMTDASLSGGEWYPEFQSNIFTYGVVIENTDELPSLTFKVSEGAQVSVAGNMLTANENGYFTFDLSTSQKNIEVKNGDVTNTYSFKVTRKSKYDVPDKVVDYLCINSQYTNSSIGSNPWQTLAGNIVSLGNFGGYITYYYENPIKNDPNNPYGVDFYVYGNSFEAGGSAAESGVVWVSEDGEKWYALAGSEYYNSNSINDYEIKYTKTQSGKTSWIDNYGNTSEGKSTGSWVNSSNYPLCSLDLTDSISIKGILNKCADGTICGDSGASSFVSSSSFGYVDYFPNGTIGKYANPYEENGKSNGFDLEWAVDENGEPVKLENGIHYIKVVTANNIWAGAFGEKSTEVGYVVRTTARESSVGKTGEISGFTISDENGIIDEINTDGGVFSYRTDIGNRKTVSINLKGVSDEDNVYINNKRIALGESAEIAIDSVDTTDVRIIVQNGEKEPLIYILKLVTGDLSRAEFVDNLIVDIGEVTLYSGTDIEKAREAYDALIDIQKALVTKYDELCAAESKYKELLDEKIAADKAAAKSVDDMIDKIGEVTLDSLDKINAAFTEYESLNEDQKIYVLNYDKLVSIREAYNELVLAAEQKLAADKAAAAQTDKLISDIGTVTLGSKDKIDAAIIAYNALNEDQKAYVTKYDELCEAKNIYDKLVKSAEESAANLKSIYNAAANKLLAGAVPVFSDIGGEWTVIALSRAGLISDTFKEGYFNNANSAVSAIGQAQLHRSKSSDNSRMVLALTSIGKDVRNVCGYDILQPLADFDYVKKQGINGIIYALVAFDCAGYEIPNTLSGTQNSREIMISYILDNELLSGGWSLIGEETDVDVTAMAIQALAPYYNENSKVKDSVDRALTKLSYMQKDNGGFASWDEMNLESIAQVIIALSSLGIDPMEDTRFIKNGKTVFDALAGFYINGEFAHTVSGGADRMATEQAVLALTAYYRFKDNKTSLYDMRENSSDIDNSKIENQLDLDAAKVVISIIAGLGDNPDPDEVSKARAAYNALSDTQKSMVYNYNILLSAEASLDSQNNSSDSNEEEDKQNVSENKKETSPKTGIADQMTIYIIGLSASFLGFCGLCRKKDKTKEF